jgi:hypothetical protein
MNGNKDFTQVHNLAAQLSDLSVSELSVAELSVDNAVLVSGLTVSTIVGNPNLALSAASVTLGAASDSLAFFGVGVSARLTTTTATAFVHVPGGGASVDADDTFGGYKLGQVVRALVTYGLLT